MILTLDPTPVLSTPTMTVKYGLARNGYVVEFSFLGSNATPFFQTINATAAILRASVSRAISARMPFSRQSF
jgi:hypothetical protein